MNVDIVLCSIHNINDHTKSTLIKLQFQQSHGVPVTIAYQLMKLDKSSLGNCTKLCFQHLCGEKKKKKKVTHANY